MSQKTLMIIKPDAVEKRHVGAILAKTEAAGLRLVALRSARLGALEAEGFYAEHRARPFFADLVRFMTSGPVVLGVLEAEEAVARWRRLMGATDPAKADPETLRRAFGQNIERNALHGSDAADSARREVAYFFAEAELSRLG